MANNICNDQSFIAETFAASSLSELQNMMNSDIASKEHNGYLYMSNSYCVDRNDKNKKAHTIIVMYKLHKGKSDGK